MNEKYLFTRPTVHRSKVPVPPPGEFSLSHFETGGSRAGQYHPNAVTEAACDDKFVTVLSD